MGILLQNFIEEKFDTLKLPSSLWSTHTDPSFESILLTEEKNHIKISTFLNNKLVHLPFAQKEISQITDLTDIINDFHNLKKCPNYNAENCNRFIIFESDNFCNFCRSVSLDGEIGNEETKIKTEKNIVDKKEKIMGNDSDDNVDYSSIFGDSDEDMYSIIRLKHNKQLAESNSADAEEDNPLGSDVVYNDIIIVEDDEPNLEYDSSAVKVFICTVCKEVFEDRYLYHEHIQTHSLETGKNSSLCNLCGFVFKNHAIQEHIETHSSEFKYVCETCGKRFPKHHSLRLHIKVHSGERPYECKECDKTYKTSSCLRTHELSVHDKTARKHKCTTCGMTFVHPHLLKLHNRIHTGEKPYHCLYCDKRFTKNIHLTVHTRVHTGEKPHICELCGKGFTTTGNLKSHKKTRHKDLSD